MGNAAKTKSTDRTLLEKEEADCRLRVDVTADEMECKVTLLPAGGPATLTPDSLLALLNEAGVREGIDQERVRTLCREANRGKAQEGVPVAFGREPQPGPDGWIEFLVRVASDQIHLQENEEGRVDVRKLNLFGNVEPGQPIGRIHPPQNGAAGITVTGLPVSPLSGAPVIVVPGAGVSLEEGGTLLVAQACGRVVQDGTSISVSDNYTISGDVDFNVGSIDFRGFVQVQGDVLDDFDIIAEKGIEIGGSIGACRIESPGNIVLGSMAGKGKGSVRCGGNLVARYLSDVHVECAGNVIVTNEIRNSVVKAAGFVQVENGVLSGGECVALAGIEARRIGSYLGVRTRLTAGVYYPEADRMSYLQSRSRSVSEQIQRIQDALGPLTTQKNARKPLSEATHRRIEILVARLSELTAEREALRDEIATFQFHDHPTANPKINVREWLGEGVVIALGEALDEIRMEMSGPLSIIENTRDGGLRFLSMSPLGLRARDMEEQLVEKEDAS